MQQDILIIGVLFPAIPLMMINFENRYMVLASLIRSLHDTVVRDNTPPSDAKRFLLQITTLRRRLRLIGMRQIMSASAFILVLGAMMATYWGMADTASLIFITALTLMGLSMVVFMREIQLGNSALDVHLSDLKDHQEWAHILQPKKKKTGKGFYLVWSTSQPLSHEAQTVKDWILEQ